MVCGDHGVGARHTTQLGRPRLIWPLDQTGAARLWAEADPSLCAEFLISFKIPEICINF
jgi:hypothetical protein